MSVPKVGLIYLTYNGKDSYTDVTRCFKSLEQLNYHLDRVKIYCVENPSAHGASWPFIEQEWSPKSGQNFPEIAIIKNEVDVGYSGANNVGLQAAIADECDYVFLLNQDADVHPDFLKAAVERAESDASIMFVQSLVLLGQNKNIVNSLGNRHHFLGFSYAGGFGITVEQAAQFFAEERKTNPDLEVPYFSGAAVLVRVSLAKTIGLFDTPFYMYHEDVDATFNARIHGYKTVIEPKSIVYHYYEFSRSIKKFYWMERNRFITLLTYYKLPTLFLITWPFMCVETVSLLMSIKSGWSREKIRAWTFFLRPSTWTWVLARRRKAQSERLISDRVFLKDATGEILFQDAPQTDASNSDILTDVRGSLVTQIANPILRNIWKVTYWLIRW